MCAEFSVNLVVATAIVFILAKVADEPASTTAVTPSRVTVFCPHYADEQRAPPNPRVTDENDPLPNFGEVKTNTDRISQLSNVTTKLLRRCAIQFKESSLHLPLKAGSINGTWDFSPREPPASSRVHIADLVNTPETNVTKDGIDSKDRVEDERVTELTRLFMEFDLKRTTVARPKTGSLS